MDWRRRVAHAASYTTRTPRAIFAAAAQSVTLGGGVGVADVSGDGSAFVLAASCGGAGGVPVGVTVATIVSTAPAGSPSSTTLTVNAAGVSGGAYVLCVRWTSAAPGALYSQVATLSVGSFFLPVVHMSAGRHARFVADKRVRPARQPRLPASLCPPSTTSVAKVSFSVEPALWT